MNKSDRVGKWFQILDERGHSDRATVLLERLDGKPGTDYSYPHREMDGAAKLAEVLRGYGIRPPPARPMGKPSFFARLGLLLRGLAGNSRASRPSWKFFDPDRKNKSAELSWILLDEEANGAVNHAAKARGVSANALLLEHLSKSVALHLAQNPEDFRGSWMLPVSMRGAFFEKFPRGNKVSYLPLQAEPETRAEEFYRQIREGFQNNIHWSNWLVYVGLSYLGLPLMRQISAKYASKVFWIGTFSDLGDWTPVEGQRVPTELRECVWVAAPIGNPNNPVSCATATWYGRKSLSLRLHPSICEGDPREQAEIILHTFTQSLGLPATAAEKTQGSGAGRFYGESGSPPSLF